MPRIFERLHARGQNNEACIVVRTWSERDEAPAGQLQKPPQEPGYRLASGERLSQTADPGVLETIDGKRRFTLLGSSSLA